MDGEVNNVKATEKNCVAHECMDCGEKLIPKMQPWVSAIAVAIALGFVLLLNIASDAKVKNLEVSPICYHEKEIGGTENGNGPSVYKRTFIKCADFVPNDPQAK